MKKYFIIALVVIIILALIIVIHDYFFTPTFTANIDGNSFKGNRGIVICKSGKLVISVGASDTAYFRIFMNATKVGTYLINDGNTETDGFAEYCIGENIFTSTSKFAGSVTITKLDLEKKKVSGTFVFRVMQVKPPGSKVINITNGVFEDIPIKDNDTTSNSSDTK